jgi:hypothetical protein
VGDIEFSVIFVIENSTKLQKLVWKEKLIEYPIHTWAKNTCHTCELCILVQLNKKKIQYIKGTHKLNMWNIFLPTYILFNI